MIPVEPGHVYLDSAKFGGTVHLLVKSIKPSEDGSRVYAECACFIDKQFFGIQEMQTYHFKGSRYILLPPWKCLWLRWRMRRWKRVSMTRTGVEM